MFNFPGHTFVIAELGINHNGSMEIAKQLIDAAVVAGCDAVKLQKRTPRMSLPPHMWDVERQTPWGVRMTYIQYREKIEFSSLQYLELFAYAKEKKILMFASPWDTNAAHTLYCMDMPLFKIASASVTNLELVEKIASFGLPVIMSTGMCEYKDIEEAVNLLYRTGVPEVALLACTSNYPAKIETLNLNRIHTLKKEFPECRVGYSGHEPGLWTTLCAVAMGATLVERHITLDRTMPGTDQAGSVEPAGFTRLVKEIRNLEKARGSGKLRVLDCEQDTIKRLRG